MSTTTATLLALPPQRSHTIRAEDFGAAGLEAVESLGPFTDVQACGPLLTIHDSTFEPRSGIGHHPHQRMERLFYILEGAVEHDDVLNGITGQMGTGDLGILTEGRRGMVHSERNDTDGRARCWILVYPNDPLEATASFDAVRDAEAPRTREASGVRAKEVIARGSARLGGDVRAFTDLDLEAGAGTTVDLDAEEGAALFVVDGSVEVGVDAEQAAGGPRHTFLAPPAARPRRLTVAATSEARVLRVIVGPGFGLRLAS